MRVVERGEARGSLKWIRRAVNEFPELLNRRLRDELRLGPSVPVSWVSPRADDEYAEYRDNDFIDLIGMTLPRRPLADFWPSRGPQWDALAKVGASGTILVEAKANIPELVSPGTSAEGDRLTAIERALGEVKNHLDVDPAISWKGKLYQYANRLAHLYLLRELNKQDAYLAFVYFTGDAEVDGPATIAEWRAALTVAEKVLGLSKSHRLSKYVAHVFIDVSELADAA